jgi:hypothetical protein
MLVCVSMHKPWPFMVMNVALKRTTSHLLDRRERAVNFAYRSVLRPVWWSTKKTSSPSSSRTRCSREHRPDWLRGLALPVVCPAGSTLHNDDVDEQQGHSLCSTERVALAVKYSIRLVRDARFADTWGVSLLSNCTPQTPTTRAHPAALMASRAGWDSRRRKEES